jgi:hypothetical protein
MQNINSNQSGFSIVEGVLIIVVVAVLGFIGWTAYNSYIGKPATKPSTKVSNQPSNQTSSPSNTQTQQPTQQPNPYADWQSYCSISGGICFKYPTDWQENETSSSEPSSDNVTVVSPSKEIQVSYRPNVVGIGGHCNPATCYFTAESIDKIAAPNNLGLEVIKGIFTNKSSGSIAAYYFLTSADRIEPYHLQLNQAVDVGFFAGNLFTSPLNNSVVEEMMVRVNGPDNGFSSVADANAWLAKSEVVTGGEILSSAYIK